MRVCVCVFSVYLRINYLPFGRTNTKPRCSQTWDGPRPLATRGPRDCDKSKSFKIIVYVLQLKYKPRLPNQSVYESSRVVGNFEDLDGLVGRAGGKSSSVVVQLGIMLQRTTAPPPAGNLVTAASPLARNNSRSCPRAGCLWYSAASLAPTW